MPVTGWNPLGLNSARLPVPYQGTTCAWTSMAQVDLPSHISSRLSFLGQAEPLGSAEPILWQSFRFLAAGNFPNTPTPRGGGTKKFEFLISRECACCSARGR